MNEALSRAKKKILEQAHNWHAGGAFSLALEPDEIEALEKAYPNGFPVIRKRKEKKK